MGQRVRCPLCGRKATLMVIENARLLDGHWAQDSTVCGAVGMSRWDALAVRRMIQEGGDRLRLAAHP